MKNVKSLFIYYYGDEHSHRITLAAPSKTSALPQDIVRGKARDIIRDIVRIDAKL